MGYPTLQIQNPQPRVLKTARAGKQEQEGLSLHDDDGQLLLSNSMTSSSILLITAEELQCPINFLKR